jgi:carbamoyl-phosphate synthase small subunit
MRSLRERGCAVTSLPCEVDPDTVLRLKPDGIVVSPGPGDPRLLDYMSDTLKELLGKKPVFGICLGHQLIGKAFGADTYKLKFGHRGGNHPVQDLKSGRTYMTAQNHGYALDPKGLRGIEVSHLNLNDQTVEGLRHPSDPIMSIQYHSEACPGPLDSMYIFDEFLELVFATK